MAKPLMSDAELRRRKKLQGRISQTTSTLGLGGLGLLGAGAAIGRKPGMLRQLPKYRNASDAAIKEKGKNLGDKAKTVGVISGGIGGVGGYNFAAYTNAESRKKQMVKKSLFPDMDPTYGEVGFSKDWQPQARKFDAEAKRHSRAKAYEAGGAAGTIALAGGTLKRASDTKKLRGHQKMVETHATFQRGEVKVAPRGNAKIQAGKKLKHLNQGAEDLARQAGKARRSTGRLGAATLGLGALTTGVAAGRRSKSWQ